MTVGQVVRALRRRLGILLLAMLVGGLLATVWAAVSTPSWSATAVVKLASLPDNPLTTSAGSTRAVNPATESAVVSSSSVAARAAKLMKSDESPAALTERVTVTNPLDSQVLKIEFSAGSAKRAADGANAFARAYLDYRQDAVEDQIDALDQELGDQADSLESQLEKAQKSAVTSSSEVTRANAQAQVTSLTSVLEQVRGQRAQLAAASREAGEQVGSAQPPTSAAGIAGPVVIAAGLAAGLVAGLVLALLRDRTDKRVRGREQVEAELGLPVIAEVPGRRYSAAAENATLRRLGAVIASPANATRMSPLLLVPVREGQSWDLAAKLAGAIGAHAGTALLCAADAVALNLASSAGVPVRSFGEESTVKAGLKPADLAEADVIVVDGLNVTDLSTSLMLAPSCAAILLVVRRRVTRLPEITAALRELATVGAQVHGVVLLPRAPRRSGTSAGAHAGAVAIGDLTPHDAKPQAHQVSLRQDEPADGGRTGWPRPVEGPPITEKTQAESPATRPTPIVSEARKQPSGGGS